ncbi:MAG TPA: NAD(P)/FAD-dependent oxidoreductase [Longimicrobiales bacterium]
MSACCDAIVVGAGPAGSATALLLARAGHHVLLLDRRHFPRAKPCGDCLSPEAARVLDRLGLLADVQAARPARLAGWRIVAPAGHAFEAAFAAFANGDPRLETAIAIRREALDTVLLAGARRAGAVVRTGLHVTDLLRDARGNVAGILARDEDGASLRLHARLVIGADGLRSVVARRLGLVRRGPRLRKLSLTAHVRGMAGPGRLGEMHLAAGACAGVAPVEEPEGDDAASAPLANVTLVVDAARFGREAARDPLALFRAMLARFPALAPRLPLLEPRLHLLASGPFDWPTRTVVADGAALVGDAAGYFDPFTGQGIYQALAGAELLAEEADLALREGDVSARALRRYAARRRRMLRGARILQHLIDHVIRRPVLADAAIRRLARAPAAAAALIAATGDMLPPGRLLSPDVALSFLLGSLRAEAP